MTAAGVTPTARDEQVARLEPRTDPSLSDPLLVLRGFVGLRRLMDLYPPGHPMVTQRLAELDDAVQRHLRFGPSFCIDIIGNDIHLDGMA